MLDKPRDVDELIESCPKNSTIVNNVIKAWSIINDPKYDKAVCSVSGGSDSDIMLDIVWRCDKDNKVDYVWFDTGLEYGATKDHLKYLEDLYGINIIRYKAIKPIPTACKLYGQPFNSKKVSEYMMRLQSHGFKWEDRPFDDLYKEYPKCKSALAWWCNQNKEGSSFNIEHNKYLKEFIVENPPKFMISNKCCNYAKKYVASKLIKEYEYKLNIVGIRRCEGGMRARVYKSCFDEDDARGYDNYRPIFWFTDEDKLEYENNYGIIHSKCYTEYGLKRTGCCACPYGRYFEEELDIISRHEPNLYKAVNVIFKDSYDYMRKFIKYKDDARNSSKSQTTE